MAKFLSPDEKLEIAMQALEDICNPLGALERNLKEGEKLNGLAVQIIKDPYYLQGIAKKALEIITVVRTAGGFSEECTRTLDCDLGRW